MAAAGQAGLVFDGYLDSLIAELRDLRDGEVATYIPELGRADPEDFAISLATVDGRVYSAGCADRAVTIQSVSKPFMFGAGLARHGRDHMLTRVGVEPTGETFNSIVLDDENNRPFNPMVNAGAIAVAGLFPGATMSERAEGMLDWFSAFAGRPLRIDDAVFASEHATGHRNRAIAWMMLNSGMIDRPPDEVLDLYFRQCSVLVSSADLAVMAATLAAQGRNPVSARQVLHPDHVRDVLSVMSSCGMYDYAGRWTYDVGLPAKSGVSGMILAVIPGQAGLAVYSPRLDAVGNSVRGVEVCRRVARDFSLHLFNDRSDPGAVIRREYSSAQRSSMRIRSPREADALRSANHCMRAVELQGLLYFGSAERVVRRVAGIVPEAAEIVLDFKRVALIDRAAIGLLTRMMVQLGGRAGDLTFAALADAPSHVELARALRALPEEARPRLQPDCDTALELFEERLLGEAGIPRVYEKLSLAALDLFDGLDADDIAELEAVAATFSFDEGETILTAGEEAHAFFVVARGSVSIRVQARGKSRRIGSIGPGQAFGEMALLDGGRRSADVTADVPVLCYAFSVHRLREIAESRPQMLTTIMGNLVKTISDRLRSANDEIRALE